MIDRCHVAILGAGPYGLSTAAHLRQIAGLDVRLIGEPMSFWERHMPDAMQMRSPWVASHIADPDNRLSLDSYRRATSNPELDYPVPVADFIKYGRWFLDQMALPVNRHTVVCIDPAPGGYVLTFDDGEVLHAERVVIAAGIQPFVRRPEVFDRIPASLATHTSEPLRVGAFRDKHVLVVGAGQSALEAAGFLCKAGARVEVLTRQSTVHWLGRREWMKSKALGWMFYGRGDIGPAGVSLVVQRPNIFRRLPRWVQDWWGPRSFRPAVLARLAPEMREASILTTRFVVDARLEGERVRARLNDGTERVVDHVVLGTGYKVDVARYSFLSAELANGIDRVDGYPRLGPGCEASAPGLHFVGAPAGWSFGPLMRFVAGTEFTARSLTKCIARARRRGRVAVSGIRLVHDPSAASHTS